MLQFDIRNLFALHPIVGTMRVISLNCWSRFKRECTLVVVRLFNSNDFTVCTEVCLIKLEKKPSKSYFKTPLLLSNQVAHIAASFCRLYLWQWKGFWLLVSFAGDTVCWTCSHFSKKNQQKQIKNRKKQTKKMFRVWWNCHQQGTAKSN